MQWESEGTSEHIRIPLAQTSISELETSGKDPSCVISSKGRRYDGSHLVQPYRTDWMRKFRRLDHMFTQVTVDNGMTRPDAYSLFFFSFTLS